MRISDWSSDVCSSDLPLASQAVPLPTASPQGGSSAPNHQIPDFAHIFHREPDALTPETAVLHPAIGHVVDAVGGYVVDDDAADGEMVQSLQNFVQVASEEPRLRSDSHTSELQSLMP